jgi:hypothetical protein
VDARQRPTAALLEEDDPYKGWTSYDYRIQEAMNIMDREICGRCGNPTWICHSTDGRIDFEVLTGTCYASAEVEEYDEKPGVEKLGPGEYRYARPVGIENEDGSREPLPNRREASMKMP